MDFEKFFGEKKIDEKNFFAGEAEEEKKPQSPDRKVEQVEAKGSADSTTADFLEGRVDCEISPSHICQSCQDSEWWIDVHLGGPHCIQCKPPAAPGMVREKFFYDEHGNRWEITVGKKMEIWRKV